jgi:hypothetical protein
LYAGAWLADPAAGAVGGYDIHTSSKGGGKPPFAVRQQMEA